MEKTESESFMQRKTACGYRRHSILYNQKTSRRRIFSCGGWLSVSIKSTRQNKNLTHYGNQRLPVGAPEPCCFALKARIALGISFRNDCRCKLAFGEIYDASTFILNQGLTLARRSPKLHGRAANARRLRPGAPALCATSFRFAKTRYSANLRKYSLREYWIRADFKAHVPGRMVEQ